VIRTVVYALLIALVIRTLAFEPFNIPSGSMTPTLLTGDYVFVSKFSYGYSAHSLPFAPSFLHGRLFGSLPKRGDVAVFVNPHTGEDYIKRIVGLPGDKIQVVHGILTINGEASKRERVSDYTEHEWNENYDRPSDDVRYHYIETMPKLDGKEGVKHDILGNYTRSPRIRCRRTIPACSRFPRTISSPWATIAITPTTAGSTSVMCRSRIWLAAPIAASSR
jgi:signal peptidase I